MKNCQEITMDIERAKYQRLTAKERLELRMHIAMCGMCRSYYRDSKKLDLLLHKRYKNITQYNFTQEEKQKIKDLISKD